MLPPGFFIRQKLLRQRLERLPEPQLVMSGEKQDLEFNEAALKSGLALSYELILHSVLRLSPLTGKAIDIGCGSGLMLLRIARHLPDMQFTGLDLSDAMLELAERNRREQGLENVRFAKHDMFELAELPSRSFELITCNNVLHHCENDQEALVILDGLAGLVSDRGTIFVFDLCRMKTEDLLITLLDYTAKDFGDYFYNDTYDSYGAAFSYPELASLLARSKLADHDYRHVKPLFGNIIQVVYVSHTRNRGIERQSYLVSRDQKIDWMMLRLMLAGRL